MPIDSGELGVMESGNGAANGSCVNGNGVAAKVGMEVVVENASEATKWRNLRGERRKPDATSNSP